MGIPSAGKVRLSVALQPTEHIANQRSTKFHERTFKLYVASLFLPFQRNSYWKTFLTILDIFNMARFASSYSQRISPHRAGHRFKLCSGRRLVYLYHSLAQYFSTRLCLDFARWRPNFARPVPLCMKPF